VESGEWEELRIEAGVLAIGDCLGGRSVERDHHPNITILRSIWSADGNVLTLFLKDTTHYGDDPFSAGFMAVCEKVAGEAFFLATVYHEWFIIERSAVLEG
jgi:hypothetical protein